MGYPRDTAPNICEMMTHGVTFDTFMAHAYQTPIAQMANFTGLRPSRSGFVTFASTLDPAIPTLPMRLKDAGYQTVAMGSSFEVMADMSAGSDERSAFKRPGLNPSLSFGRGFDRFIFTGNRNQPTDAIPWMRAQSDEPWFLWLVFGSLHWPYGAAAALPDQNRFDPPEGGSAVSVARAPGFRTLSRIYDGRLYSEVGPPEGEPVTAADDAVIQARYDVGLWAADRFIGELVDTMSPAQLQSTVIVLYGIHGEDLGEHGYYGHYDVFDVETRMAMVVLDPKLRTEGLRISEVTEGVDLAPTVLDLLGLPPIQDIDGVSLVSALEQGHGDPQRTAIVERVPLWEDIFRHKAAMPDEFTELVSARLDQGVWLDRAIRDRRYKLIHRTARTVEAEVSWYGYLTGRPPQRPEWELYDLTVDPTEQANIYDQQSDRVAHLQEALVAWEGSVAPSPAQ
jgi:arylsulfatase A-like enzyme